MKTISQINKELESLFQLIEAEKKIEIEELCTEINNKSLTELRNQGLCRFPLKVTDQLFNSGERLMLKLEFEGPIQEYQGANLFKSGKTIRLFLKDGEDDEYVDGVINNSTKSEITLTLNTDSIKDWMLYRGLCVQLIFDGTSYKEMNSALKSFIETDNDNLNHLKSVLYGGCDPQFSETIPFLRDIRLNDSQNEALRLINNALDVAVVHGPPGTGKTTTLVRAIIMTLKTEKRVLVCAPSNAAADLITEKLANLFVNVVRIGQPARITDEVLNHTLDYKIANHPNYKDIKLLRRRADEFRRMAGKYKRNFGEEERRQRSMLYSEARKITEEADNLAFYISNDIISKAEVITCTLVGAANREIADLHYRTVFIDEAAQALEPACFIPIIRAERVIFAGDHCQLPPTVKSREAIKGGLSKTLFEKIVDNNIPSTMLCEQYRMNKIIMQFSNQQFYDGKLIANSNCADIKVFDDDMPLEFIDTAGTGFVEKIEPKSQSTYNAEEADLLVKYLTNYLQNVELLGSMYNVNDIGIISPYKAQAELISSLIKNSEIPDYTKQIITIDTADSFQGREKDIIFISLVRTNSKGEIGFLKDTRRMNVAMTRAKRKLVIFADSATICHNKFYDNLISFANDNNAYRSAFEIMY
ncbi:MAG: AAA domain-containing protein [Bacteroidales bacterium]|nr:AAA domain-containing protein [Bacteroidales bacterium]